MRTRVDISNLKGQIMAARTIALSLPAPRPGLLRTLLERMALQRQRQRLAGLPDHLLKDIGVTREAARDEADRPAWDAPAQWTR
jgi:uncharacterized protein YjiS (DUF1127 family)